MRVGLRWAVRLAVTAFGLLICGVFVVDAVQNASGIGGETDDAVRTAVLLMVIGGLLKGLGLGGVFFCQAAQFRDWSSWSRPLIPRPGVRIGVRHARRAARQIDGVESYQAEEVPELRRVAELRVSLRRFDLAGRLAAVSLVAFFIGIALAPPGINVGPVTEAEFSKGFGVLGTVMAVVLVTACVVTWRVGRDVKAEAFLERTSAAACPLDRK